MFEGLAAGLQRDLTGVLNMFLAIFIHKSAAALSLGISLVKTFPDDFTMVRWLVFIFSIATPIGVIAGMILTSSGEIYTIVFSSIAAGTFLYISASEVVVQEFSVGGQRFLKYFFYLVGATIIISLWFLPES